MFAEVVVNVPAVSGTFDYRVPDELASRVNMGQLVTVPFGKQTVQGVIVRFMDTPSVQETKSIIDILDPLPVLTHAQIMLADETAKENLAPVAAMVSLMLPPGLSQQGDVLYSVNSGQLSAFGDFAVISDQLSVVQKRVVDLLQERGPLRGRQID
ncbi:MAG: hypothetical protein AB1649_30185, partial [Chloroflexota bacterium]